MADVWFVYSFKPEKNLIGEAVRFLFFFPGVLMEVFQYFHYNFYLVKVFKLCQSIGQVVSAWESGGQHTWIGIWEMCKRRVKWKWYIFRIKWKKCYLIQHGRKIFFTWFSTYLIHNWMQMNSLTGVQLLYKYTKEDDTLQKSQIEMRRLVYTDSLKYIK